MKKRYIILLAIFIIGALFLYGCGQSEVKLGDTVKLHYTLKLDDGSVYQTTRGGEPAEFILGNGSLIPGFENALLGMKVGEKKTVHIPSDAAYPYHEELVVEVPFSDLQDNYIPKVGGILKQSSGDGSQIQAVIIEVKENSVIVDANFPLAGKDLTFEIELMQIIGK